MANNDQILLEQIIQEEWRARVPDVSKAEFFELYVAEQVLKDSDLTDDEIESGLVGSGGDGGIDAIYTFANGELVQEDFDFSGLKKNILIEVVIIQTKTSSNFDEDSINRLISVSNNLFDLGKPTENFKTVYNESVRAGFDNFRRIYLGMGSRFPSLNLRYIYATLGDSQSVHPNVRRKVEDLKNALSSLFQNITVDFGFVGAADLMQIARRQPITSYAVEVSESLTAKDGYIALIRLNEFIKFIRTPEGLLNKILFEANVRDYQGNNQVNEDMQRSLSHQGQEDFWWLNNGVTIVASKAVQGAKVLTIEDPQIVNGQQTSTEIFNYFINRGLSDDSRSVMVRVIVANDPASRDRIIKATNNQTLISAASLRATDKIHRDIESYLSHHGIFYDRRKNSQKQLGHPVDKIISIGLLAQSMMTILLGRPADARARPSTLIKDDSDYARLFNADNPIEIYLVAAKLVKKIHTYLRSREELAQKDRTNLLFYVVMYASASLSQKAAPKSDDLVVIDVESLTDSLIDSYVKIVNDEYVKLGGNDSVAKGSQLTVNIKQLLQKLFSLP